MDLIPIYQESKLYRLPVPLPSQDTAKMSMPAGFSGVAVLYEYEPEATLSDELAGFLKKS